MAVELSWWPMSPWLSPGAAWFIFFNVIVGAIAVMSREQGGSAPTTPRRKVVRTASTVVMERLRSISIFSFNSAEDGYVGVASPASQLHNVQDRYSMFEEQEALVERKVSTVAPESELRRRQPGPVAAESGAAAATTAPPSEPVVTAPASERSEAEEVEKSISLDEAYALARARRQPPADAAAAVDTVARGKREPAKIAEVKRRAHACGRGAEEVEGKAEVNERAERFIRQFREELKLERLSSLLNHTHALRRGGCLAAPP